MDAEVYNYLVALGLKPSDLGFRYLLELAELYKSGEEIFPLKNNGYRLLAARHGVKDVNIDKNIQNAISKAWLCGDIETQYREFGNTIDASKGKPTVKQLLAHVCMRCGGRNGRR